MTLSGICDLLSSWLATYQSMAQQRMEPVHRYAFLQAIMAKGMVPETEANSYLKLMTGACSGK